MKKGRDTVFIGLSGGVDSAVSAALLKKAGFDVTGVFIKVWQPDWITCTWKDDRLDAMRVCASLDIPFIELNLEETYKREVVDYMIREYTAGRTPNPDVFCNTYVKFGDFYRFAREHGAKYVATGHYAQVTDGKLIISKDDEKDQTYFLANISREVLPHIMFPIGHLEKTEVRKLAAKFHLPVAEKKDSQGLCFVGKIDMKDFLTHFITEKPGNVVNSEGIIIGNHRGVTFFTIGERHGFEITVKTNADDPYYVIGKNIEKNELIVSNKETLTNLLKDKKEITLIKTNWLGDIKAGKSYTARLRYRAKLETCTITNTSKDSAIVTFNNPQTTATPGQFLVVYDDDVCLGGGIIA